MHEAAAVARSIVSEENKKKDSVKRVKCICPRKKVVGRRKAERRIAAMNESEGISGPEALLAYSSIQIFPHILSREEFDETIKISRDAREIHLFCC